MPHDAKYGEFADGQWIELGGQWLGPTQDRMYELVEELGLKTVPLYNEGKLVLQLLGKRGLMGPTKGTIPRLGPFALADLAQGIARFGRLSKTVDLERPWRSPDAAMLDGQTSCRRRTPCSTPDPVSISRPSWPSTAVPSKTASWVAQQQ